MSDKERKEVEQMIKESMVGGRLSLSLLATRTQERVQELVEIDASSNNYYTQLYAQAQREVLGVVESDYKPSKDAVRLVKKAGPASFTPGQSINQQGYVFFDNETASRIDNAHYEIDKLISDARVFVHVAQEEKSAMGGKDIIGREKTNIEGALKKFLANNKGGLDDYAKEQIAGTVNDLKKSNITVTDDALGNEIKALNGLLTKNKTNTTQR